MAERSIATFAQSFLAVFVVGDMGTLKTAAMAGATALLSVVKSGVASRFGDGSASSID
tara:strand:- start:6536 stop:6709 length:174 start_codon:yes stop_codon:yes gene_type:complete